MSHDPILHALLVRLQRVLLFLLLSLMVALGLWLWVLLDWCDLAATELWSTTRGALAAEGRYRTSGLVLRGCVLFGVQASTIIFLVTASWWRRSGDVHQRGTKFIDARGED